jgi:FAD dependent oxidoreductase
LFGDMVAATSGRTYDVVVAGGGSAGVGAGLGAARVGARTLLLERNAALGGAATARNVLTFCGLFTCRPDARPAVGGVAADLVAQLYQRGGASPMTRLRGDHTVVLVDPEAVKAALDDVVAAEAELDLLLGVQLVDVEREGDRLLGVEVATLGGHRLHVEASAFVDASGDGVLSALGGARVAVAPQGSRQTATLGIRFGGVGPDADVSGPTVREAVGTAIRSGAGALTSSTGLVTRLPGSNDVVAYLADEDLDALDPVAYTAAIQHARRQARAYLEVMRSLPGCEGAYLVSTGPELGIRQSRHIVARHSLADRDLREGVVDANSVALASWPSEFHPGVGLPSRWLPIGGDGVFGIPLDSLRHAGTDNLVAAGRLLGGELRAAASVRVLGTSFATGQAAGVAAAHLARSHGTNHLSAETVRQDLERQGAMLSL